MKTNLRLVFFCRTNAFEKTREASILSFYLFVSAWFAT